MSNRKRIRAHANPLSESDVYVPLTPDHVDWSAHYPTCTRPADSSGSASAAQQLRPTIADIGCGFGGLTVALSTVLPDQLIIALEIRDKVVEIVQQRIQKLRAAAPHGEYRNISVINCNVMKHITHYFHRAQLHKVFFCFPDPHFKRSNYRRRIINQSFLDYYAYILAHGGLLYFITDVADLYEWMVLHCTQHPLFERVSQGECDADQCYQLIHTVTEEGQKVQRIHGSKYAAVFRRVADKT